MIVVVGVRSFWVDWDEESERAASKITNPANRRNTMTEPFEARLERTLASLEVKLDALAKRVETHQIATDALAKRVETHQIATERVEKLLSEIRVTVNGLKQQKT